MLEDSYELPRLTSTLRAFSNVSKKYDYDPELDRKLIQKRKEQQERAKNPNLQSDEDELIKWENVITKLMPNPNDPKFSKLKTSLDKLRLNLVKQYLNEDFNDNAVLNEAALFVMRTFYDHRNLDDGISNSNFQSVDKITKKLKEKFGQFVRNLFDDTKNLMETVFNELKNLKKYTLLDDIFGIKNFEIISKLPDQTSDLDDSYFGESLKFLSFYDNKLNDEHLNEDDLSSSESDSDEESKFDFKFPDYAKADTQTGTNTDQLKYLEWTQQISKEICPIVYEILSKKPNNNESQNELLELLGFENIELIGFLFANQKEVVAAYKTYMLDDRKKSMVKPIPSVGGGTTSTSQPVVASELLIHTESEKKIKKQIRKEEKRLNKKNQNQLQEEFGDSFDPATLRKLREHQLSEARIFQLYNQMKITSIEKPKITQVNQYPFVFDSMLKIAQTCAFIAGAKIMLPEDIKRTDDRVSEEVYIPASESLSSVNPKDYIGTKEEVCFRPLVKIEELDNIGQIAFRNTKSLNRIQSIVFDVAYNTNQNLLICAPTGAGKTNIAMLTVVNQINKNFEDGVLKKDNFKIVYVAPMKALAAEMVK